ncbi:MAG: NAD(P)-dependent oxidoreductase [Candidatus Cloacimonetes bacterium]|nr:NAD(P)-dependent oxidoreductase [Candidatus Cloacimonadota bacterium]
MNIENDTAFNFVQDLPSVLMTGITGFIGKHTALKIMKKYNITALIRPNTKKKRYTEFENEVRLIELDLSDKMKLQEFLEKNKFDFILHIGALRGGRAFSADEFLKTNVVATETLLNYAVINNSKFIFCSSVGVFGAIPVELPANNNTPFKEDNLYHKTKIICEKMIQKAVLDKSLKAYIVRPAITYGKDDYGFPYTLTKLVDKRLLFIPDKKIYIHLTNVDALAEAFSKILENDYPIGKIWTVADYERVNFNDLIDFIYERIGDYKKSKINQKNDDNNKTVNDFNKYPKSRVIRKEVFVLFTKLAKFFKNELWTSRFELISNSWYYDVKQTYVDLKLKQYKTIPEFKVVVDWYCKK